MIADFLTSRYLATRLLSCAGFTPERVRNAVGALFDDSEADQVLDLEPELELEPEYIPSTEDLMDWEMWRDRQDTLDAIHGLD